MLSVRSIHTSYSYRMFLLPKATKSFPPLEIACSPHHPLTNESACSQQPLPRMRPTSLPQETPVLSETVRSPSSCFHFPSTLELNAFFQRRLSSDSACLTHTHLPIHNCSHKLPLSCLSQLHVPVLIPSSPESHPTFK